MSSALSASWISSPSEGQLAIDVFRRGEALIVRAPIAGVDPDAIRVQVQNGLLTIRGERIHQEAIHDEDWFHRECYWGSFSRSVLLPEDIDENHVEAQVQQGILEIHLPIRAHNRKIVVRSLDDEPSPA